MAEFLNQLLGSRKRLERESGISKLKLLYDSDAISSEEDARLKDTLKEWISTSATDNQTSWEKRHGAIMAVAVLVEKKKANDSFVDYIKSIIPGLLEDHESRVRIETGQLVSMQGTQVQEYKVWCENHNKL